MKPNKLVLSLALLLMTAVIPLPSFAHSKLEPRINDLEAQVQRLQLLLEGQGIQDMYLKLQSLEAENRSLRGNVEQLNYQLQQLQERQRQFFLDTEKRMQELESRSAAPALGGLESNPEYAAALAEGEEAQYRKAFNLLKDRKYEESIAAFEAFNSAFANSSLAPNAYYWMGEANYAAGRYQQAVKSFDFVRTEYADSPKVADAMVKLGFAYAALGQSGSAKSVLQEVQQRFPGTAAAKLAQDRLNSL
jgi:tol-pal system protein YbgF